MAKREVIAEQDDTQGGTYRLEMISCGKDRCRKCAEGSGHGPYWYRYYRRGGRVVSKYVGKELPAAAGTARAAADGDDAAAVPAPRPGKAEGAIADALIKNILDAARPEHRAGILAEIPPPMRAEVDAAIARAEEAQRRRAEKSSQPAAAPEAAADGTGEIRARIAAMSTRQEVRDCLASLGLRKPALLALARELDIATTNRDTVVDIRRKITDGTAGAREDAAAIRGGSWNRQRHSGIPGGGARPAGPGRVTPDPVPVSGQLSARALTPNRWGSFAGADYPVNYHKDGMIGLAIDRMGQDALLDVDGEPLAELLGRAATDAVVGRASSQEVLGRVKRLRDRLPQGGAARRELDEAVRRLDAPDTPVPAVPAVAPAPLRRLMADLHAVPLVRRDPSREEESLARVLDDFAAGKTGGSRLILAVRGLRNQRHESVEGKFEVDRAVTQALDALEGMYRADRKSLYLPAD